MNFPMTQLHSKPGADPSALPLAIDRASGDFRRGQPVAIEGPDGQNCLAVAIECLDRATLMRLTAAADGPLLLALTERRAAVLGLESAGHRALAVALPAIADPTALLRLADPTLATAPHDRLARSTRLAPAIAEAAIELAKLARLLPAALLAPLGRGDKIGGDLLAVTAADILAYPTAAAMSLTPASEARVPLVGAENARVVAFRPSDGSIEHLAIIVGAPDPEQPVLTRIHSECFTGDLLGSLRCDCGDQLRGALAEIGRQGSGLLLYLAQEGRGIGLVNKLRAYRLQDGGADTAEANEQLGFDADERLYLPAAQMLRQLGYRAVRLMTNNPEKVAALKRCGILVTERVPLVVAANRHNESYLVTKAAKFGHMF